MKRGGMGNYFSALQDPTNPNSTPAYDEWGPDFRGYWSLADWITWHQALTNIVGLTQANQTFLAAWNNQSSFAQPVNDLETDVNSRAYFQSVGLLTSMNSLKGAATDLATAAENFAAGLPGLSGTSGWILPAAVVLIGLIWLLPSKEKVQSAKSLFGK